MPELLPRPTKKELAARVRASASAVTRCFKDPSARELNLYWRTAVNLDRLLASGGPSG